MNTKTPNDRADNPALPVQDDTLFIAAERRKMVSDLSRLVTAGELLIEDFCVVYYRYRLCEGLGFRFPPEFVLLMKLLHDQCVHTGDDDDSDDPNADMELSEQPSQSAGSRHNYINLEGERVA